MGVPKSKAQIGRGRYEGKLLGGRVQGEQSKAGQGRAWQGKARQGKARQGKARQGKARQGKARQGLGPGYAPGVARIAGFSRVTSGIWQTDAPSMFAFNPRGRRNGYLGIALTRDYERQRDEQDRPANTQKDRQPVPSAYVSNERRSKQNCCDELHQLFPQTQHNGRFASKPECRAACI